MNTTPPPPSSSRLHTPPTPMHGPQFDNYEPYSPRRSNRVASKRVFYCHPPHEISVSKHRAVSSTTPTDIKSSILTRTSSQTFSPPSSPGSPVIRSRIASPKSIRRAKGSEQKSRRQISPSPHSGSDTDILPTVSGQQKPSSADSFGMLQTPAKTPRKRVGSDAPRNGTSRVLFPGRPVSIDDAMPSPRQARKSKYPNPFAIAKEENGEGSSSSIQIYTDTKERVPTLDEDASNPFLTKNAAKPNKRQKKSPSTRGSKMEREAKDDEGMVYVFRGKKVFRKFVEGDDGSVAGSDDNLSDMDFRRRTGLAATYMTRASIKPRLLFPSAEQRREREAAEEADEEEEVTDVEVALPHQDPDNVTPVKEHFAPTTPPSTGRPKRGGCKKQAEPSVHFSDIQIAEDAGAVVSNGSATRSKSKRSPFDGWARAKPSTKTASKGNKREGETMESTSKRTRSAVHAESTDTNPTT